MAIRQGLLRSALAGAILLPLLMAGCVSSSGDVASARLTDNFAVYAPFDNERDWGPSYLVGAPYHYLGDGVRIDDTRAVPSIAAGTTPADPNRPPSSDSEQASAGSKPQ
jgi:hypothetical protein